MREISEKIVNMLNKRYNLELETAKVLAMIVDVERMLKFGSLADCQCDACVTEGFHTSDCAVHNEPMTEKGDCTCGRSYGAPPYVNLLVKANLSYIKGRRKNRMALTFADCGFELKQGDKIYGDVHATIGGSIQVSIRDGNHCTFTITGRQFWNEVVRNTDREDLIYTPNRKS